MHFQKTFEDRPDLVGKTFGGRGVCQLNFWLFSLLNSAWRPGPAFIWPGQRANRDWPGREANPVGGRATSEHCRHRGATVYHCRDEIARSEATRIAQTRQGWALPRQGSSLPTSYLEVAWDSSSKHSPGLPGPGLCLRASLPALRKMTPPERRWHDEPTVGGSSCRRL